MSAVALVLSIVALLVAIGAALLVLDHRSRQL